MRVFIFWSLVVLLPICSEGQLGKAHCPSVDLSSSFPALRDQGNSNICHSFVAADLIGYRLGLPPSERISALDVATNLVSIDYAKLVEDAQRAENWASSKSISRMIPILEEKRAEKRTLSATSMIDSVLGNSTVTAILAYNHGNGACREKDLPSEISVLEVSRENYISNKLLRYDLSPPPSEVNLIDFCRQKSSSPLKAVQTLNEKLNDMAMQKIQKDFDTACAPRRKFPPLDPRWRVYGMGSSKNSSAIALMLSNKVPVAISYNKAFLKEGLATPPQPPNHASSIVGSRWNENTRRCEFKLRDSDGPLCSEKAIHKDFLENCRANDGYIWIDETEIDKRVDSLSWINP